MKIVSLKNNMIASYAAQIYVALASIVMLPIYLRYMGSEAYGLVAFFVMLQGWMQLLDMGLSPTMARDTAQFRAGAVPASDVRRLLHMLERMFATTATIMVAALVFAAPWLATHWLHPRHLTPATVDTSLMLMAPAIGLRLCSGLYRGAVTGLEQIVWLSAFNVTIATMRYALVIAWFAMFGVSPVGFFAFQLVVAVVEIVVLRLKCHAQLDVDDGPDPLSHAREPRRLKAVLFFSLSVGIGSTLWSTIYQIDNLILSRLLSLTDYGYFSLVVVASGGVGLATGPISIALSPRLVRLHAMRQDDEFLALYRRSTQLVVAVAMSAATILICFPEAVLWAWTGRADVAQRAASTLALYAAGNAIGAVLTMTFYLQFAKGDLRLHIRGLLLLLAILFPTLIWATLRYGMLGAGAAWLGSSLLYFGIWIALIHRRFAPGLHLRWVGRDVLGVALPPLLFGAVARLCIPLPAARIPLILSLAVLGGAATLVSLCGAPAVRAPILKGLARYSRRRTTTPAPDGPHR